MEAAALDPLFDEFSKIGSLGPPDPYAFFGAMRKQGPVLPSPMGDGSLLALGYDAVSQVFRDSRTYSSTGYANVVGKVFGHSILEMDPPEHTRYRALVQQAFTRRSLELWRDKLVVPYANELIDAIAPKGRADLTREFAFPFPLAIIAGMLDVPERDRLEYMRLAIEILSGEAGATKALHASKALADYFAPRIEAARGKPGEDLITLLANAELDGARLSVEEILPFIRLLSPAAFETTARAFSNLMCALLNNPEQLDAVQRDKKLIPQAVQEGLRWEPPLVAFSRWATRDTELCGVPVKAGCAVAPIVGAANRDPERWENPDAFDIHRPAKPHIAFAMGAHTCLGMHLATLELETALELLLKRLPNLRRDPDAPAPKITGGSFRTAISLPVVF
ncbi:MAG: cytochrome P450 [Deltaproteobacteria bacterium]|nr:cytochrome P450 [Deltaproteobacteria bacterium]